MKAMCDVSEGYSVVEGRPQPWANRPTIAHATLAGLLQQGPEGRQRIKYYHAVAKEWMEDESIDILAMATTDAPIFPMRSDADTETERHFIGQILGYSRDGSFIERRPCPYRHPISPGELASSSAKSNSLPMLMTHH